MSQLMQTLHAVTSDPHLHTLAADSPVPDVVPSLPKDVDRPVDKILGWTAGLGLAGAVMGGLMGWAAVAVGHNSERASLAARGKQGILWSLFGAGGIGLTSALVLTFFNLTNGGK
ncbi:hypothetical protein [Streptomyces sp. NPDC006784]|uniref:hypothetical protein n=1 Tax=Streptomyces sp. NPDC006784 TaxID=3364764 RepID=UPI0036B0BA08